jgi:hypothetical protein
LGRGREEIGRTETRIANETKTEIANATEIEKRIEMAVGAVKTEMPGGEEEERAWIGAEVDNFAFFMQIVKLTGVLFTPRRGASRRERRS